MNKESPITLGIILKILPIVASFIGLVIWCANLASKVEALDVRQSTIEIKQTKYDDNYNELKNSVTRIEVLLEERLPAKK